MDHQTYSIYFKGSKRYWLKKQIGLARICAHEVPLNKAQFVFVSAQDIKKLPKQGSLTAIIPSQHEPTVEEQREVQTAVMEGRVQITVPCLDRNLVITLTHWFPPITSCRKIPQSIAA